MATIQREKIYECEVKRYIKKPSGARSPFWKIKNVAEAVADEDKEYRCKDCHGKVKLFRKHVANGPASHVEHADKQDSEYCAGGMYFLQATDGRTPRLAADPVV